MGNHHFQRRHNDQIGKERKADIHQQGISRQQSPQQIHNVINRHISKYFVLNITLGKSDQRNHQHGDDADDFQNQQVRIQRFRRIDGKKAHQTVNAAQRNKVGNDKNQRVGDVDVYRGNPIMKRPNRNPRQKSNKNRAPHQHFPSASQNNPADFTDTDVLIVV